MEFTSQIFQRRIGALLPIKSVSPQAPIAEPAANKTGDHSSETVDLSAIWDIREDKDFLDAAYQLILRRPCDLGGFVNCIEMLRSHVSRRVVVLQLVNSGEAARTGATFTGIPDARATGRPRWRLPSIQSLMSRPMAMAQALLRRALYLPLDSINGRLTLFIDAVGARLDLASEKADQNLWVLAQKIDASTGSLANAQLEQSTTVREGFAAAGAATESLLRRIGDVHHEAAGLVKTEIAATTRELKDHTASALAAVNGAHQMIAAMQEIFQAQLDEVRGQLNAGATLLDSNLDKLGQRVDGLEHKTTSCSEELKTAIRESSRRIHPPILSGGDNILVTEIDGFIVGVPGEEWRIAAFHAFRGVQEPGVVKLFQTLVAPGMTVVDIGANIGVYSLYACRLLQGRGTVHSFEPTPRTFAILRDNIQVNGFLETGLIEMHPFAVSDKQGTALLTVYENNCGHNTLFHTEGQGKQIPVGTTSLDAFFPQGTVVDVIKIDAEGAEPFVLRGMNRLIAENEAIRIVLEFAPAHLKRAGLDPAEFLHELSSVGFSLSQINDETGECSPVDTETLLRSHSSNLYLTKGKRAGEPECATV